MDRLFLYDYIDLHDLHDLHDYIDLLLVFYF
jgi:hypothetical protein